jgi:hypothetical protein
MESKSFDGVIGLTSADPQRDKAAHEAEVNDIRCKFESGQCHEYVHILNSGLLLSLLLLTLCLLLLLVRKEGVDEDGGMRLDLPIGMATVRGVVKALNSRWLTQRAEGWNLNEKPGKSLIVKTIVDQYERRLVSEKVTSSLDRAANCPLRDAYSPEKFVEMMARLWRPIRNVNYKILRDTNISTRMSLALRHQMCLRDQDVRDLDLADCFSVRVRKAVRGVIKPLFGLVFSLKTGKTVTAGTTQFAVALRHKEYVRCAVGAFAFHLFQRFHVSQRTTLWFVHFIYSFVALLILIINIV